ncbi:MAG: hypothetical protein ACHQ4H_12680 [Ktedonobacterales bacterium]|nr:hypothetical protein [Chloroflexota bacterium]
MLRVLLIIAAYAILATLVVGTAAFATSIVMNRHHLLASRDTPVNRFLMRAMFACIPAGTLAVLFVSFVQLVTGTIPR